VHIWENTCSKLIRLYHGRLSTSQRYGFTITSPFTMQATNGGVIGITQLNDNENVIGICLSGRAKS